MSGTRDGGDWYPYHYYCFDETLDTCTEDTGTGDDSWSLMPLCSRYVKVGHATSSHTLLLLFIFFFISSLFVHELNVCVPP